MNCSRSREAIVAKLQEIFREILDNDSVDLSLETSADEVVGWDSLAHVRIIIATEAEFRVRFEAHELLGLRNVGGLVEMILRRMA